MLVVSQAIKLYKRFTPRQYLSAGIIILALGAMLAIGFVIGRNSAAAAVRDCGETDSGLNSIANNSTSGGGCGALSPEELITDINNGNPDDQGGVMAHFGLTSDKYQRFKDEGVMGVAKTNGDIEVEGQVVGRNAWSIGRVKFNYSSDFPIDGVGNYFKSAHTDVLQDNIPVMVLFDDEGMPEFAVLTSCGNPVKMEKVKSAAECKKLIKTPVEGKKDTFSFTTEVATEGLAKVVKLEYFANGEKFAEEINPSTPVTKTFTEDSTVVVKVTVSFPGNKTKVIESVACTAEVKVEKEVPPKPPEKPKPEVKPAQVVKKVVKEEVPLPVTGPADAAALFAGTSLAGAIGHRVYSIYRERKTRK